MKRTGILNSDLSAVLGYMRHTDCLTVGDCGLPVPENVECIDLAVKLGLPGLMDVLTEVQKDLKVEKMVLAEEIKTQNPGVHAQLLDLFAGVPVVYVPHTQFKQMTADSKALVRTGEATAYANVILQSACIFAD